VPLRLRDRSQIGRDIDCPDCGTRLRIMADAGEVRAERAAEPRALDLRRPRGTKNTLRLIWGATACLGVMIVWIASRPTTTEIGPTEATVEEESPEPASPPSPPQAVVESPKESSPAIVEPPPALPEAPPAETPPAAAVVTDDRPIVPDLAPDPPPVDIAAQLSLPIEEYSQSRPVEVRLLLRQIAELSAVTVDLSAVEEEPWKAKLDQAISIELKATTVAGVLNEVLNQAGLTCRHSAGVIFVLPPPGAPGI